MEQKATVEPVPFTTDIEARVIGELLDERKPETCLEWGSGGSTLYFPSARPFLGWVSLEHDPTWYEAIKDRIGPNVELHLIADEDEYCRWPLTANREFDFVLVDGIRRNECMEVASRVLKAGGIVLLHDSGRLEYRPAYGFFKHYKELAEGVGPLPTGSYDFRGLTMFWNE